MPFDTPSPAPQVDWELAVRRVARIRLGRLAIVGAVGALSVAGPVALAASNASARQILTAVAVSGAAALAGWIALDRQMRRVIREAPRV